MLTPLHSPTPPADAVEVLRGDLALGDRAYEYHSHRPATVVLHRGERVLMVDGSTFCVPLTGGWAALPVYRRQTAQEAPEGIENSAEERGTQA